MIPLTPREYDKKPQSISEAGDHLARGGFGREVRHRESAVQCVHALLVLIHNIRSGHVGQQTPCGAGSKQRRIDR